MKLDQPTWKAVEELCHREDILLVDLIEKAAVEGQNRTNSVRQYALAYFRDAATEKGHRDAGHGKINKVVW